MNKIIIYDFDGTLTPYALPKLEILEKSGLEDDAYNPQFLELTKIRSKEKNIDLYKAVYDILFEIVKNAGFKLTDENLSLGYDNLEYNTGVIEYLNMISKNNISNYLLSSGMKICLDKTKIASYFKEIYATTFTYDHNNEIDGFEIFIDDKNKVTIIKEILKKNDIDNEDCSDVIYIGDGVSDFYAMEYIKEHGGTSIFVRNDFNIKDINFFKEKSIVDFYTEADFSENSKLYNYVKKLCKIK